MSRNAYVVGTALLLTPAMSSCESCSERHGSAAIRYIGIEDLPGEIRMLAMRDMEEDRAGYISVPDSSFANADHYPEALRENLPMPLAPTLRLALVRGTKLGGYRFEGFVKVHGLPARCFVQRSEKGRCRSAVTWFEDSIEYTVSVMDDIRHPNLPEYGETWLLDVCRDLHR